MADLFISHSAHDTEWARALRRELDRAGYTCWMAPDDVHGPTPWAEQILAAITSCRVMIVLISRSANSSHHVSKEVGVAIENAKALLPIRTEEIIPAGALNYLLQLVQWVDAFPGSPADHQDRIRTAVEYSISPGPESAPTAPRDAAEPAIAGLASSSGVRPDQARADAAGAQAHRGFDGTAESGHAVSGPLIARKSARASWGLMFVAGAVVIGAAVLAPRLLNLGSVAPGSSSPPASTRQEIPTAPVVSVSTRPTALRATATASAGATPSQTSLEPIVAPMVALTFPDGGYLWDVAAAADGAIAVGDVGAFGEADGWVWLIRSGGWERVASSALGGDGNQLLRSVQAGDRGFVVTGQEINGASLDGAIWSSMDGRSWERSASESLGGEGNQVVRNSTFADGRWIAIGRNGADGRLWSSADAVTWEIIPASEVFKASAGTQHLDEILSGSNDEPWVIVGRAGSAEGTDGYSASGYAPVAWYSPDGLRWAQAEVEPAGPAGSRMNAVVHSQSGWVAVGTASWSAREVPVVWRSADARAWTVVRDAIPGPGFLQCVSNAPGQIVAAGSSNGVATAWQSADGVAWSPIELPSTRVARTVEGASFRVDGSLLLVGGTRANDPSQFAAAWDSQ